MTSPRRSRDRPVESVALKMTFAADRETRDRIRKACPSAVFRGGRCEVELQGALPEEVAAKARALLDAIRESAR
jgi:hypothetical protein